LSAPLFAPFHDCPDLDFPARSVGAAVSLPWRLGVN
jgi:hypothetical protein